MTRSRRYWRRAHLVSPPQRSAVYAEKHAEMYDAYLRDQWLAEGMALLAAESERDAREYGDAD